MTQLLRTQAGRWIEVSRGMPNCQPRRSADPDGYPRIRIVGAPRVHRKTVIDEADVTGRTPHPAQV